MIWPITQDAVVYIVMFLEAALVVGVLAFFWHNLTTAIVLWFTDRKAFRERMRRDRAEWDERDGW